MFLQEEGFISIKSELVLGFCDNFARGTHSAHNVLPHMFVFSVTLKAVSIAFVN
uniref:Uncharacterized protein n=1 Tax=Fundulus heteroclitus TaxID=8078 RepID=A0A146QHP8_FUNHE